MLPIYTVKRYLLKTLYFYYMYSNFFLCNSKTYYRRYLKFLLNNCNTIFFYNKFIIISVKPYLDFFDILVSIYM